MMILNGLADLDSHLGDVLGTSGWLEVSQRTIDDFAHVTGDEQWLHVERERAAHGPYGTTIAHGYLILSLLPRLAADAYAIDGSLMRINYGLERVRFPSPVPSGARVRVTSTLTDVTRTPGGARIVVHNVVESEGAEKPACVADTVSLLVFDEPANEERSSE
jgi:acyl dehydratase